MVLKPCLVGIVSPITNIGKDKYCVSWPPLSYLNHAWASLPVTWNRCVVRFDAWLGVSGYACIAWVGYTAHGIGAMFFLALVRRRDFLLLYSTQRLLLLLLVFTEFVGFVRRVM